MTCYYFEMTWLTLTLLEVSEHWIWNERFKICYNNTGCGHYKKTNSNFETNSYVENILSKFAIHDSKFITFNHCKLSGTNVLLMNLI